MMSDVRPDRDSNLPLGLAVDDTRLALQLMLRALRQADCVPQSATNGLLGWLLIPRIHPDIVITDLDMPVWGGLKLVKAIRNSPDSTLKRIPIIVCSATEHSEDVSQAIAAGATYFLPKPIDVKQLCRLVKEILQARAEESSDSTSP